MGYVPINVSGGGSKIDTAISAYTNDGTARLSLAYVDPNSNSLEFYSVNTPTTKTLSKCIITATSTSPGGVSVTIQATQDIKGYAMIKTGYGANGVSLVEINLSSGQSQVLTANPNNWTINGIEIMLG